MTLEHQLACTLTFVPNINRLIAKQPKTCITHKNMVTINCSDEFNGGEKAASNRTRLSPILVRSFRPPHHGPVQRRSTRKAPGFFCLHSPSKQWQERGVLALSVRNRVESVAREHGRVQEGISGTLYKPMRGLYIITMPGSQITQFVSLALNADVKILLP